MVSAPFADHCEPLVDDDGERAAIVGAVEKSVREQGLKYAEVRAVGSDLAARSSRGEPRTFALHTLDLVPSLDDLFARFHRTAIQQPIRRAERESLRCESGRSEAVLDQFYTLLIATRRRHGLPPQPRLWFKNLIECLGDRLTILVASRDGRALAGILTLRHKNVLVYKYGCSDQRFHHLGAMPCLLWKAIVDAKNRGLSVLDFGRTDASNPTLATFKERWGATRSTLTYVRWGRSEQRVSDTGGFSSATRVFARLPDDLLIAAGRLLYRHMG
jgi:hypothetical protein